VLLGLGAFQLYDGTISTSGCDCTRSVTTSRSGPYDTVWNVLAAIALAVGAALVWRVERSYASCTRVRCGS
jgi:uncharacterized membrane protein